MKKNTPFLLEIGTEEVPARFFVDAIDMMQKLTNDVFVKNSIEHSDIQCFATPRRMIVSVSITDDMQKTTTVEVSGPPARAAFDKDGKPTKAAEGFAKAQGVNVHELKVKDTPKGQYIVAVKETKGAKVSKILPLVVPEIIKRLHFPKNMRWGHHTIRFVRPIRWILCLYGSSVVRFEIDGIKSSRYTFGHRLLAPRRISIKTPTEFEKVLGKHHVVIDQRKRKTLLEQEIKRLTEQSGMKCIRDDELLDTVNFLVEKPFGVLCTFPEDYLQLPPELLVTVMKDHQKYFAVQDKKGHMNNAFIVISNTSSKNAKAVRSGAEKVIKARFEDARFYYMEDVKTRLADRLELLKEITFHEKLGSLYDKVQRIRSIALSITEKIDPSLAASVSTISETCKADLTTGVVREFPELQGAAGYHYALHEGMSVEIASAIQEHYKPLNASDTIPASHAARIVGLADKIDSIVGFFSAGIIPSGSEDPYALRRQAQGIIQILFSSDYALPIQELIDAAIRSLSPSSTSFLEPLRLFFIQRVEYALSMSGFSDDIIKSTIGNSLDSSLSILQQKAEALVRFKRLAGYSSFITAIKRVRNILPNKLPSHIDKDLLMEGVEKNLYKHMQELSVHVNTLQEKGNYLDTLKHLETITSPVNAFFEGVLVMDKDERIRQNRLALLGFVWDTVKTICDFSRLSDK